MFLKVNKKGITRIVFLIGKYAIKIPNYQYQHDHFLQGCYANWSERKYCKGFKNADYKENMYEWVAPSYFCSWFGLVQIQARCEVNNNNLTDKQKKFYKSLCGTDFKKENFGYLNGKLVCLDYP
jgi:hypothetical protein